MAPSSSNTRRLCRALGSASIVAAVVTFVAAPAGAHFTLDAPASMMSQDVFGGPQKLGPCGDEGGGTATGAVTAFARGQTIQVTIDEKIFHPGHYRIALAVNDPSELPAEPKVTPADTPCGSVEVQDPPVYPVLADGVFEHTDPFSAPQTVEVTLPADVTCANCTLQVIEFMSEHPLNDPGGCFYHHCANISIGEGPLPDGGSSSAGPSSGGCGCSTPGGDAPAFAGLASLLALATLLRLRRR
jgi:MYXO-CTERM domain-containing protein